MSLYEDIVNGLKEAIAYEKGEITLRTDTLTIEDSDTKKKPSEDNPLLTND